MQKQDAAVKTFNYKLPDTSRGKQYASFDSGKGVALLPEKKTYTGTLIKGIAIMHKSNAVPVIKLMKKQKVLVKCGETELNNT